MHLIWTSIRSGPGDVRQIDSTLGAMICFPTKLQGALLLVPNACFVTQILRYQHILIQIDLRISASARISSIPYQHKHCELRNHPHGSQTSSLLQHAHANVAFHHATALRRSSLCSLDSLFVLTFTHGRCTHLKAHAVLIDLVRAIEFQQLLVIQNYKNYKSCFTTLSQKC